MPDSLFEPFTLGNLPLANRIVMAPMTRARAGEQRVPNDLMREYYLQRSSVGLILTEATSIDESANGWTQTPGLYTDEMVAGWRSITEAIHEVGGKIFAQLWHTGRASHSSFRGGQRPVAPSAIAIKDGEAHTPEGKRPYETPRALETDEVAEITRMYGRAAEAAMKAGFDGVELHAANGYLPDEFLQSKTNHREDRYGGSIENRFRFVEECLEAIFEHVDASRVGMRISPNGAFNDMGSEDYRETFLHVARKADEKNLVYLHVMDGLGFGFHELGEPMTLSEFRGVYSGAIIGNVGYDLESSTERVRDGDADLIAIGRPLISNPDLVNRWRSGQPLEDDAEMETWYSHGAQGYTDFPTFAESLKNPANQAG